jgi:hypothetical protein
MMATWTVEEIATLKAACASGILTVRYDGPPARMVTYQSLKEMRELLAEMQAEAAEESGTSRYKLATTRTGL